ncbi:MAG: hypothetical protein KJZ54_00470 [Phycisphaerales bacterium]|nr:hypothetical protein [Phycisphaerales bacterium]
MAKRAAKAPVVRNVAELGASIPRGDLLVHFTKDQWTRVVRNAKPTKGIPRRGGRLEFTPDPNGNGTAQFVCNPGPGEECSVRVRPDPNGGITYECRCTLKKIPTPGGGGGSGGGRLTLPPCILRLPRNGPATCLNAGCAGRCELRTARVGHRIALFCVCA